jgi:hypothetical protein
MFALLVKYKGKWHFRCNDGEFRVDPWFGTYGDCMKSYKTMGSAKGAWERIKNNSIFTDSTEMWVTNVEDESCSELWQRVREGRKK